jgi:hypothetical protein
MNRLRRFYEKPPSGQKSGRVAYATSVATLAKSLPDVGWLVTNFSAGDAILADPTLKDGLQGGNPQGLCGGEVEMKGWKWTGLLRIQLGIIGALVFIIWIILQNPARWG